MFNIRRSIRKILRMGWRLINGGYFRLHAFIHQKIISERNEFVDELEGERIIVLAPHVDDDIIGCGGAILNYLERKKSVFIIYLTDGCKLGSSSDFASVAKERKREAESVAREAGIDLSNLYFLEATDGQLLQSDVHVKLGQIIFKIKPTTIFLPVPLDIHIDHYAASKVLAFALKSHVELVNSISVYLYESQSPITNLYSNISLNITKYMARKVRLTKYYKSQPSNFNFVIEQGRSNALTARQPGYREIFLKMAAKDFLGLYEEIVADENNYNNIHSKLIPHSFSENHLKSYLSSCREKTVLMKF